MDARDVGRRSCSPRARSRRRRRSSSSSRRSSTSSDNSTRFSRRNRRSRRQESTSRSRSRSRSPRGSECSHRYRRRQDPLSRSRSSRDDALYGDTFAVAQAGREPRAKGTEGVKPRRIAPNASALKSIMLGTARSRDRMDERERARAQKKLESLNSLAKTSTM